MRLSSYAFLFPRRLFPETRILLTDEKIKFFICLCICYVSVQQGVFSTKRQDETKQDKTKDKTIQGDTRRHKMRQGKTRQDKARQVKTRQKLEKKTRQNKAGLIKHSSTLHFIIRVRTKHSLHRWQEDPHCFSAAFAKYNTNNTNDRLVIESSRRH